MADISKYPEGFETLLKELKLPSEDPAARKAYLMALLDRLIRQ